MQINQISSMSSAGGSPEVLDILAMVLWFLHMLPAKIVNVKVALGPKQIQD